MLIHRFSAVLAFRIVAVFKALPGSNHALGKNDTLTGMHSNQRLTAGLPQPRHSNDAQVVSRTRLARARRARSVEGMCVVSTSGSPFT